jgi:hypothetical protein
LPAPRGRRAGRTLRSLAALSLIAAVACDRLPTGPAHAPRAPARGIILADWTANGYAAPSALSALDAIARTGARVLPVVVTAYQADARASAPRVDAARTPSAGAVRTLVAAAAARGLAVAFKPHVDLDGGGWRGTIEPGDAAAWFAAYRAFIRPWAALAESIGAPQFVIGTELAGTLEHEAEWRETIREVRAVYSGEIVYAASWDEAARVRFWDALDRVGVDFYFPVASRENPGRLELLAGWQPWLERLERLHRQSGRPILITEIGYPSVNGAGMRPYAFDRGAPVDVAEQADLYWAALEATGGKPWIAGLWWWNWLADGSGGAANADYTPNGKPAAAELAAAWR